MYRDLDKVPVLNKLSFTKRLYFFQPFFLLCLIKYHKLSSTPQTRQDKTKPWFQIGKLRAHYIGSVGSKQTWFACPANSRQCARCKSFHHFSRVCLESISSIPTIPSLPERGRGRDRKISSSRRPAQATNQFNQHITRRQYRKGYKS